MAPFSEDDFPEKSDISGKRIGKSSSLTGTVYKIYNNLFLNVQQFIRANAYEKKNVMQIH